jgi:hypothetical protein
MTPLGPFHLCSACPNPDCNGLCFRRAEVQAKHRKPERAGASLLSKPKTVAAVILAASAFWFVILPAVFWGVALALDAVKYGSAS